MKKQRCEEPDGSRVRGEKSQKRKDQKKEDAGVRKGRKVAKHCFFRCFAAPEGRKVGSLKRQVRRHLGRCEMKSCTPLWREAHFEVKMYKTPGSRSTFGSWDVEKVHAVVARSTFRSQNVQNTPFSDHFWKLRRRKSARRCGAKHISKSKCTKHFSLGPLLEVEMSKKCTPLWREAHFQVKSYKTLQRRTTFGSWDVVLCGTRKGLCTLSKVSKTWVFCSISKNDGRRGAFEEDLQRCMSRARCSTKDMFIRDVRPISWERLHFGVSDLQVCWDDFAWQVQHFVWPGINFSWQAQYFTQVEWKNRKTHWYEAPSAALNFPFLKEVSQNCFVFDVVKFKHWGSLAELLRFWTLLGWQIKEVSQNCFVFDVVKFEKWGSLAEEVRFQSGR